MAILVRTNAQLPAIEDALGAAGIPFHVRGERFFARPEVRRAIRVATALARVDEQRTARDRLATAFERELGVRRDTIPDGEAASERHGAVVTLLELAEDLVRTDATADVAAFLAEVERRTAIEAGGEAAGVELLTYHRAKGLEWDAVFLPALEEGTLPIRQATEPAELGRGAAAAVRRDHPGTALPVAVVGDPPDGRHRSRGPAQPLAVPRRAGSGRGAIRVDGADARTAGSGRPGDGRAPKVDPGGSLAAVECLARLADGACPGRRRRAVHRLPRLDDRGHRRPPATLDGRAPARPGRRPDEARPLRRGDHRRRRPRLSGRELPSRVRRRRPSRSERTLVRATLPARLA